MNSALMIGVILIIAGIALTILAYFVSRSDAGDEELEEEQVWSDQPVVEALDEPPSTTSEAAEDTPDDALPEPDVDVSPTVEPALMDSPSEVEPEAQEVNSESKPEATPTEIPLGSTERIHVATLLRDDVTGKLIIRVGDREYSSPEELRDSTDWTRVEYAASDLSEWMLLPERKSPSEEAGETESEAQAVERKPSSMIEQINSILQEMIENSGRPELAVRLLEGPGGMARVLIGVHSYEIAEVPDPEVRELIRKAVAAWESTQ
jgi:hypothetical protein